MVTDRPRKLRRQQAPKADPIDPHLVKEVTFFETPSIARLIEELKKLPRDLPVFVNGEGWASALQVLDPTGCKPFQFLVLERHLVIG